jgi:hypothetical protein
MVENTESNRKSFSFLVTEKLTGLSKIVTKTVGTILKSSLFIPAAVLFNFSEITNAGEKTMEREIIHNPNLLSLLEKGVESSSTGIYEFDFRFKNHKPALKLIKKVTLDNNLVQLVRTALFLNRDLPVNLHQLTQFKTIPLISFHERPKLNILELPHNVYLAINKNKDLLDVVKSVWLAIHNQILIFVSLAVLIGLATRLYIRGGYVSSTTADEIEEIREYLLKAEKRRKIFFLLKYSLMVALILCVSAGVYCYKEAIIEFITVKFMKSTFDIVAIIFKLKSTFE